MRARLFALFCLAVAVLLLIPPAAYPADAGKSEQLSSPLSLKQALGYAKNHPRTLLSAEGQNKFPARSAIFLDCQRLAFTQIESIDNQRNRIETPLIDPLALQKIRILQAFFDVRLADLNNGYINEKMAGAYIDYDRAKTRFELKQLSERVVADLHTKYQAVLQQFRASEAMQRITRSSLAMAINHPEQLPTDLAPPRLFDFPAQLPELETLYQSALNNNAWFNQLKKQIATNQDKDHNKAMASLMHMELRQQILELLLRLNVLKSAREQTEIEHIQRELDLDMSRTLYDMEVKADLGDSMTLQSKTVFESSRIRYCQYLAWAQLNGLQGLPILNPTLLLSADPASTPTATQTQNDQKKSQKNATNKTVETTE